jgi:DNA polymerase elongation subunit (family B)
MNKNFKVINCDTDSIMFCNRDGSPISKEDQEKILEQINAEFPEKINFSHDGYYQTAIVFAAKNYVLHDPFAKKEKDRLKVKGSAIKDQKKEKALKEFQSAMFQTILEGRDNYTEIYEQYVKEILDIKDISRWTSKKTISKAVLTSPRTNEKKVRDAIEGTDYREGDRVYVFFKSDESLCLQENFSGDYHKIKFLEKLFKSTALFKTVLPVKELFLNYALKKNQKLLQK